MWWTYFQWLGVCFLSSVILCIGATFPVAVFKGALEVTMETFGFSAVVRILGVTDSSWEEVGMLKRKGGSPLRLPFYRSAETLREL